MTKELLTYRGQWVRQVLESSLPHIVVDVDGKRRAPLTAGIHFGSRAAATHWLRTIIKLYDKRRRDGVDDPRTWAVRPVRTK